MSAGIRQFVERGALRQDRAEPPTSIRSPNTAKADAGRLRIVRAEEPTAIDPAEELFRAPRSLFFERMAQERAPSPKPPEVEAQVVAAEPVVPREPGVDLSMLRPEGVDTARLSAFVNAGPAMPSDKDIAMPSVNTDLQAILKGDKICMVARSQEDPPAAATKTVAAPPPPVAAAMPSAPPSPAEASRYVVENWPKLPPNVQAAILNVIDVAIGPDD